MIPHCLSRAGLTTHALYTRFPTHTTTTERLCVCCMIRLQRPQTSRQDNGGERAAWFPAVLERAAVAKQAPAASSHLRGQDLVDAGPHLIRSDVGIQTGDDAGRLVVIEDGYGLLVVAL